MAFYAWLCLQAERIDAVGTIAGIACNDRKFPRKASRLYIFLRYYECQHKLTHEQRKRCRDAIKRAHAEWRVYRATLKPKQTTFSTYLNEQRNGGQR